MRCSECAADVDPLREFCPHCGTATHSSLSQSRLQRSGERSPAELQRNRKTVLVIAGGIAALLVVMKGLPFVGHGVHIDIDDDRHPKGAVVTTATDIASAYAQDPAAAEKKFGDREITVSGEFLRIVPDGYGSIDMRLKTTQPDFPLGADLVDASVEDAKRLTTGQQVTVSCRDVAGAGNDRWLRECAIQPTSSAAPSVPSAPPLPPAPSAPTPPPPPSTK